MPALRIPREYEQGLVVIKALLDSEVDGILESINRASPAAHPSAILAAVRQVLAQRSEDEIKHFTDALFSLYFLRAHSDVDIEEFVDDLIDAIKVSENDQVRTSSVEELAHLRKTLRALLTIRVLTIQSKADELRMDFANIFWDARVITDIRPVWDGDVSRPPEGTVITNTLKLEYHYAGGHGELYLYVDRGDIDKLLSVLKKAQDKTVTLESLAASSWMRILREQE